MIKKVLGRLHGNKNTAIGIVPFNDAIDVINELITASNDHEERIKEIEDFLAIKVKEKL